MKRMVVRCTQCGHFFHNDGEFEDTKIADLVSPCCEASMRRPRMSVQEIRNRDNGSRIRSLDEEWKRKRAKEAPKRRHLQHVPTPPAPAPAAARVAAAETAPAIQPDPPRPPAPHPLVAEADRYAHLRRDAAWRQRKIPCPTPDCGYEGSGISRHMLNHPRERRRLISLIQETGKLLRLVGMRLNTIDQLGNLPGGAFGMAFRRKQPLYSPEGLKAITETHAMLQADLKQKGIRAKVTPKLRIPIPDKKAPRAKQTRLRPPPAPGPSRPLPQQGADGVLQARLLVALGKCATARSLEEVRKIVLDCLEAIE